MPSGPAKAASQHQESTGSTRWSPHWALFALLLIVVVGVVVILVAVQGPIETDSFRSEILKAGIQLVAVAGLGSGAAIAVFSYQERTRQIAENQRKAREEELRRMEREHDDVRRQEDRQRDARQRQDELNRHVLQDTIRTYNKIKSIRRNLRAALVDLDDYVVPGVYDEYVRALIDQQLQFEELKRLSPLLKQDGLEADYEHLEKRLGKVIEEYEAKRRYVCAPNGKVSTDVLPELQRFLDRGNFWDEVAQPLYRATTRLQETLLTPFDPTSVRPGGQTMTD